MAKLTLNALLKELRGKLDGATIRLIRGQLHLSRKPRQNPKRKLKPGEVAQRGRFKDASVYAHSVQENPAAQAFYEPLARARDLRIRAVAIGDWFNAPEVQAIDGRGYHGRTGDRIRIRATDDVAVVSVRVTIRDASGQLIETGDAAPASGAWRYTAKTPLPAGSSATIEAIATDRPGNSASLKQSWPVAKAAGTEK